MLLQVVNWSTWLSALVSCKDRVPVEFRSMQSEHAEDEEPVQFNLLKATGDLLMLPKEILLDSEIRTEVLPIRIPSVRGNHVCVRNGIVFLGTNLFKVESGLLYCSTEVSSVFIIPSTECLSMRAV